jgi:adenosylcobinamide-phosphate synthase
VVNRPIAAAAGIIADRLLGEPPVQPHPVAVFGQVMQTVERHLHADSRVRGAGHAALGVMIGVAAGHAVRSTAFATYIAVAGRSLGDAANAVGDALAADDLDMARQLLPALVGRDPSQLDEKDVCRAVVESVAENTVDAVVAPALWAVAAGAPGVLAHRAINTMDAMVGHRDDRYQRYGSAAARLDDIVAWLPARATAVLVALCRPRATSSVWRAVRSDAPAHPSPNSGVAEAAFAAALGLRLGGPSRYGHRIELRPALGDGRPAERADIARAVRLSADVGAALAGSLTALGVVQQRRRRRR